MSMNPVAKRSQDRILIIESEPSVSEPLISVLKRGGFSVAHVPDCPETLIKINELNPDIIIIVDEASYGDKDTAGFSKLRSIFCRPIILLGINATGERWLSAMEAGVDFCFSGPLDDSALIASLRAILRKCK